MSIPNGIVLIALVAGLVAILATATGMPLNEIQLEPIDFSQPSTDASQDPSYQVSPDLALLFGRKAVSLIDLEALPDTDLDLVLQGILGGAEGRTAIIRSGSDSRSYAKGERISNAEIVGIEPNLVVLDRAGDREVLRFPRLDFESRDFGNANEASVSTQPSMEQVSKPVGEGLSETVSRPPQDEQDDLAERLRRIREG